MQNATGEGSRLRRIPQQSRSRDRVERILDTAAEQVVASGVDAVGTRAIAEAAGVPVASLYQYFADKDDILLALIERDVDEMDAQVEKDLGALDTLSIRSIVETTMSAFVTVYRKRPAFIMIWLRGRSNQAIREYCRQHNRRLANDLFVFGRAAGLLADAATERFVDIAIEIGDRLFQLAYEDNLDGDPVVLEEASTVVCGYLDRYATALGRQGIPADGDAPPMTIDRGR